MDPTELMVAYYGLERHFRLIRIRVFLGGGVPNSMGDGWILPLNLTLLDGLFNVLTTQNYVRYNVENGFIPINYVGAAQIIC